MVPGHPTSRPPLTGALLATAGVTLVVAMSGIGARATYNARTTADEPQYLLSAISVGEDLDLDISDELADQRFLDFHEVPLNPQTLAIDDSGRRVSPHDPLLPILLAAPMRIGGWAMARVAMAVLAALTAAATVWLAVRRFGVQVTTAAIVGNALFSAPPLVGYATQIYPEMAAALATVIGVAAVTSPTLRRPPIGAIDTAGAPAGAIETAGAPAGAIETAGAGCAAIVVGSVIALPWLSVKYVPIAVVIAIALLAPLIGGRRFRSAAAVGLILAGAGVLYLVAHQRLYGGWTVYAAGDHFVGGEFDVVGSDPDYLGRSRRLVGLVVDREFGLVAWAPVYLLVVPAVTVLVRRHRPGSTVVVSTLAAGWATATWLALTMHGWWWPGRQVVVVLPMVVVAIAVLVDRRPALRRVAVVGSLLGTLNWLWLAFEASTGRRTLVADFAKTANPLYRMWSATLPDHRVFGPRDVTLTVLWVAALGGSALLAARDRPEASP